MKTKGNQKGFTLMEIILVIALMGIVFGFTAFMSIDSYKRSSFHNERNTIVGILQRARGQSMNNVCIGSCTDSKPHGVHFAPNQYTIFQGASYATRDYSLDEIIDVKDSISITGPTDIIFAQLSGDASTNPPNSWDLTIQNSNGNSSVITINAMGQITWTF